MFSETQCQVSTSFTRPPVVVREAGTPVCIDIVDEGASGRAIAEAFIHEQYARAYGADVRHFLPRIMCLRSEPGALRGALGFRRARGEQLFLENYLDVPIDRALHLATGQAVDRFSLVEVGNLAVASAGGARWLIAALTSYLKAAGYDWAVFTAVTALRNAFERLGVRLTPLAPATLARLAESEHARWGRYYDTRPQVVAANVHQSFAALSRSLDSDGERRTLQAMWNHAFATGLSHAA